jgi:MFS family permease
MDVSKLPKVALMPKLQFDSYLSILRNKNYLPFWLGFTFSTVGDSLTRVALTWFVFEKTRSPQALGILTIAYTAPILISGLFAGPLLDRFPAQRVMFVDNLIRGLAFALLPILYALGRLQVWHVYIFAALYGLLIMISLAGGPTLIPSIVEEGQLDTANAMETLSFTLSGVIGPPLAGLLIVLIGTMNVVIIDALSYLVFALVLSRISVKEKYKAGETTTEASFNLMDAAHLMTSNKVILSTTLMFMCANIGGGIMSVYLPLVSDSLAPNSPKVYGILVGALSLGEVISAALAGSLVSKMALGLRIALAQILAGAATALLLAAHFGSVLSGLFLLGFFSAPLTIWAQTLRMQVIPPDLRGRTFALLRTLMQGATPLGGAFAGFLLPVTGIAIMIALSALVIGLPGLAGLQVRELRRAGGDH